MKTFLSSQSNVVLLLLIQKHSERLWRAKADSRRRAGLRGEELLPGDAAGREPGVDWMEIRFHQLPTRICWQL